MTVLADLGAGTDRGPGIDHSAFVDIGAQIDEAGHQHDAPGDEGRPANDAVRDGAEAGLAKPVVAPALELRGNLVPPAGVAARPAADRGHVVQPERQQDGFLGPLVDGPGAAGPSFRHPKPAFVQGVQGGDDGVANGAGRGRANRIAVLPCGVDSGSEVGKAHGDVRIEEDLPEESSGAPSAVNAAWKPCQRNRRGRRDAPAEALPGPFGEVKPPCSAGNR